MYQYRRQTGVGNRIGGCITGIVIVALLIGGLGFLISRVHNGVTLKVGAHPTVIGDSCNGPIFIQAGPENQVTLAGIFPQYSQDSESNTIEITQCDAGMTITVPPEADLQMDANDQITVIGVSGIMKLSANGSRVTLEQVTLEGKSKVDDNGGAIVLNGNIAQNSTPTISCNGGSIDMTLPANASFHLDMTGILGPVASDFPGVQNPTDDTSDMQLNIGSNPSAIQLTIDVNDTAFILNKAA